MLQILSADHLQRLLAFKPKTTSQWRSYVCAGTLMDTGIRIEEALGVRQADVDLDKLLPKVRGKGRKERLVPVSFELRRAPSRASTPHSRQAISAGKLFVVMRSQRVWLESVPERQTTFG